MARVFSAVDIESQDLLRELETVRNNIDLGFNPVPVEKMHVTLQFFEDLDEEEVGEVRGALRDVSIEPFTASVEGTGAFPSEDYIRVVWAGIEDGRFRELYSQAADHGVEEDSDHDFTPHITLMRVRDLSRTRKRKLQKQLDEYGDHLYGELKVNSVKLLESRFVDGTTEYRTIEEVEL